MGITAVTRGRRSDSRLGTEPIRDSERGPVNVGIDGKTGGVHMEEVVIVSGVRTPVGDFLGSLEG